MFRSFALALASASLAVALSATTAAADQYARATELGKPDLSILCPSGSTYDALGGGCFSCPSGGVYALGQCTGARPGRTTTARRNYKRSGPFDLLCKPGTFIKPGSAWCYACPRGHIHNPALAVDKRGVCFTLPAPFSYKARKDETLTVDQLINPRVWVEGVSTLGCGQHGSRAFPDLVNGGSCWACPASHPTRTLQPVTGPNACARASCGAEGERPCYVWERVPSCRDGLAQDFIKNACVPPTNIACRAMVGAVRDLRRLSEEARARGDALTQGALDSSPALKKIVEFAGNAAGQAEAQAAKMAAALPLDRVLGDLDGIFADQARVRAMEAALQHLLDRHQRVRDMLLDPDVVCGDPEALERVLGEALAAADEAHRLHQGGGVTFGSLLFPAARADAASDADVGGASVSYAQTMSLPLGNVNVPFSVGIEAVGRNVGGRTRLSVHMVVGMDILRLPPMKPFEASGGMTIAVSPTAANDCPAVGGQVTLAALGGISFDCKGLTSFYITPTSIGDKVELTKLVSVQQLLPSSVGSMAAPEKQTGRDFGKHAALEIGANTGVRILGSQGRAFMPQ
ncbi:MAG: hypothetical protein AAF677_07255 [Pseudomonadota bacterium]